MSFESTDVDDVEAASSEQAPVASEVGSEGTDRETSQDDLAESTQSDSSQASRGRAEPGRAEPGRAGPE